MINSKNLISGTRHKKQANIIKIYLFTYITDIKLHIKSTRMVEHTGAQ